MSVFVICQISGTEFDRWSEPIAVADSIELAHEIVNEMFIRKQRKLSNWNNIQIKLGQWMEKNPAPHDPRMSGKKKISYSTETYHNWARKRWQEEERLRFELTEEERHELETIEQDAGWEIKEVEYRTT